MNLENSPVYFNTTSGMFEDNGYNVLTLDFRHPELSSHFNILEPVIKEYEKYIDYEKKAKEQIENINGGLSLWQFPQQSQSSEEEQNFPKQSFPQSSALVKQISSLGKQVKKSPPLTR